MRAGSLYGDGPAVSKKTSLARMRHSSKRGGVLTAVGSRTSLSQPVCQCPRADRAAFCLSAGTQTDVRVNIRGCSDLHTPDKMGKSK